ncbi:MAG TPA: hypothetical protein VN828_08465, partial [Acidobacteriaceae bacterium]|nr:hypothetical protein [Acidobacteriaceae bacterium]
RRVVEKGTVNIPYVNAFLSSLTGLGSGMGSGSQDFVLGYSRSSLRDLVSGLRSSSQDLRPLNYFCLLVGA